MKLSSVIAVGLAGIAAVCAESFREQRSFRVTHYEIKTPKMKADAKPVKLVFLSDLHNHEYGNKNERLLQAIAKERPDLILIGGDMLIGKRNNLPTPAVDFVKRLPEIAPVYYAAGNHEQRMKEETKKYGNVMLRYRNILEAAGAHFLENESVEVELEGVHFRLSGLELSMKTYEKFRRHHVTEEMVTERIGECAGSDVYQILLAHNPVFYPAYKDWGADLVLSGHLHGGVVRIPGWRGVITPQFAMFPKYSGEMTCEDGQAIVVSRGLGTHTIKFRLFNEPELVVLHMQGV